METTMLTSLSDQQIQPVDRVAKSSQYNTQYLNTPSSPKTQELRARQQSPVTDLFGVSPNRIYEKNDK